ncbi:hypothetical protein [Leifsonia xyli]|uniref:hypothetical protein n=1 Tax=Leifsonia xyli TaxID=1575 RepID=UPI000A3ED6BA
MSERAEHLPLLPDAAGAYEKLLAVGFDTEELIAGWSVILLELRERLAARSPEFVLRAKEKFALPTFVAYYTGDVSEQDKAVAESAARYSESVASLTCQWCSRPGRPRSEKIITVACDGCLPLLLAAWDERHAPIS